MNDEKIGFEYHYLPGRCGTCKKFPGNGNKCKNCTVPRGLTYGNDYGKGMCGNYEVKK